LTSAEISITLIAMAPEENKEKTDTAQDWLILSIIFWVMFVLIVSLANVISPNYIPPIKP
jgi:hypothetical protein